MSFSDYYIEVLAGAALVRRWRIFCHEVRLRFDSAMPLGQRFGWARRGSSGHVARRTAPLRTILSIEFHALPGGREAAVKVLHSLS
jgi:hypothetical protein